MEFTTSRCRFPEEHLPHTFIVESLAETGIFGKVNPRLVAVHCDGGSYESPPEAVQRALRGED